jgi:hypothetical protein
MKTQTQKKITRSATSMRLAGCARPRDTARTFRRFALGKGKAELNLSGQEKEDDPWTP